MGYLAAMSIVSGADGLQYEVTRKRVVRKFVYVYIRLRASQIVGASKRVTLTVNVSWGEMVILWPVRQGRGTMYL